MGATDNAFIRVFDGSHSLSSNVRKRSRASGVTVNKNSVTVATEPALVSEVYAGVADGSAVALTRNPMPGPTEATPSTEIPSSSAQSLRLDSGSNQTPSPHLRPSVLAQASAVIVHPERAEDLARLTILEEGTPAPSLEKEDPRMVPAVPKIVTANGAATATEELGLQLHDSVSPPWYPEWEVDRFRWPKICDRLTQESAASLSGVVRPVLSSAWRGKNVLAVTSFGRNEGSSTIALCVARMAASFNVPVALVDGDLEDPSIGSSLGVAYEHGWNDMALPMPLKEIAIGSLQDHIVVLPVNEHAGDVDPGMAVHMLKELSNNFELVVIDAGPIFTAAYRWFAEPTSDNIQGTLIVRDMRETGSHQIEDVCSRLEKVGISEIAIVENFRSDADDE